MIHWARAHPQEEFEVGDKASNSTAGCFSKARSVGEFKQRICILLVPVDGEIGRLRAGWSYGLRDHSRLERCWLGCSKRDGCGQRERHHGLRHSGHDYRRWNWGKARRRVLSERECSLWGRLLHWRIGGFGASKYAPATVDTCAGSDACESACGPV